MLQYLQYITYNNLFTIHYLQYNLYLAPSTSENTVSLNLAVFTQLNCWKWVSRKIVLSADLCLDTIKVMGSFL